MNEQEIKESKTYKQLEVSKNYYKTEWEMLSDKLKLQDKYIKQLEKEIKELREENEKN